MVVAIVIIVSMLANTGIFLMFAGRAIAKIQVELFDNRLCICRRFDLNHQWEIISIWERYIGYEYVSLFDKIHPGGL